MKGPLDCRPLLWFGLAFVCVQSALAGTVFARSAQPKYRIEIEDRRAEQRFLIMLTSLDDRPLCIPVEKWPNQYGQLHFGASWVKLQSNTAIYRARDNNFGYCINKDGGPCTIRVRAGDSLKGFVGYREFGKVTEIAALKEHHLVFPVIVWACDSNQK
jgi:hypothetical protein